MPKVHFIGICGVGMSGVAKLLMDQGWEVSGSDEGFYPPISDYLKEYAIPCSSPHAPENIPADADLIVIGKHAKLVPETNAEVKAAFESGIPVKSYPEVLSGLTENTHAVVVAGSFGKSTCTTMLAWILQHAGKDPSYFVGALSPSLETNARSGKGPDFILEGDEYPAANWDERSKFMFYHPRSVLLTSCEHDHLNVYPNLESYLQPFIGFLKIIPEDGLLVSCLEGENVAEVLQQGNSPAKQVSYSFNNSEADWWAENVQRTDWGIQFTLVEKGTEVGQIQSQLLGDHNIQNIVGVAALLLTKKLVTIAELQAALAQFKGVHRRMELKTENTSIPVYEDFGSSRPKALAGLQTVRQQFPDKRMIVLFEPHTFSLRNRAALPWYDDLFEKADLVIIHQPPQHGSGSHDQLSLEEIVERVVASGKETRGVHSKAELLEAVLPELKANQDVILLETSGDLGGAIPELVSYVQEHFRS